MINLLPDDHKKSIRAARMNVVLLRYNIITIIGVGILLAALGLFFALLSTTRANAEQSNIENQQKLSAYSATKNEAAEYQKNLTTAKQILDNRVDYTSLIFGITSLLPKGVVLDNVNLSQKDFGSQTSLSAHASSYEAATQLKQNFQQSKMFSNVFFQTVNNASTTGNERYPISVSISVKINKVEK